MTYALIVKQLLVFAVVVSLATLAGPIAGLFHLSPSTIPLVHAATDSAAGAWLPAGAQEQTLSISLGNSATSTQVGWLLTGQVDAGDSPLTASQIGASGVNCASSTTILCSLPVSSYGNYGIGFNLTSTLWGIPMGSGNSVAGTQLRQGIAHLINKSSFTSNNNDCQAIACTPQDPIPLRCTTTASCSNGGFPAPNPCGWDTLFPESSSSNCVVGAPGGTAFNCSFSTACPTGTVTGTTTFPWQPGIGSPDFCGAAQHFISAFADAGISGVATNANCELIPPSGGWPSSVLATSASTCAGIAATSNVCMIFGNSNALGGLGQTLAQGICALFSPAWGAWTTLAGQPSSCDNSNTGTSNAACGGGPCPILQTFPEPLGFPANPLPQMWIDPDFPPICGDQGCCPGPVDQPVPCVPPDIHPIPECVPMVEPCDPPIGWDCLDSHPCPILDTTFRDLNSAAFFSTCLASPGPATDPTIGAAAPTFASCSGGIVSGGAGSTSCVSASPVCSSLSATYQADDYYGSRTLTIPIYSTVATEARLSNWSLGSSSSPGISTMLGGMYSSEANFFNWLNAYSSAPAVAGTFRQSFLTTVNSLNPFSYDSPWEAFLLGNIYDTLFVQNPLCTNSASLAASAGVSQCSSLAQNIDWMTTSHSFLCYPGGPACSPTTLGYGNSTYFANTAADLRLTLNRSNHWQDAGPVTAWDVKYSFMNLNATGSIQALSLSQVAHINVLDEFTLDVNLKARGLFTETGIGDITIIPGHLWSACGASTWNSGVTGKDISGTNIVSAPEDACVGAFGAPNIVTVGGTRADSPTFDPVTNNFLIGSSAYTCQSIGGTGHPAVGTLGGGCSIDNTQAPAFGLGDFTLTRTGCTLTATGTTCGIAGSSSDYFRSSGALAKYVWTGVIGSGSADFSKVLTVNSCHSSNPSANCPHWAQGIGNPGGTGSNAVGLSQRLAVNSLKGISWIGFSTEKTTGTQLILACKAAYTLPGTTITPCTATNAGWTGTVLPGIGGYATTLYEVGSTVLSTSTSTLAPASVVGCAAPVGAATAYPNGGYDC